jgi:N-acetylneuraminic acid mutarotase
MPAARPLLIPILLLTGAVLGCADGAPTDPVAESPGPGVQSAPSLDAAPASNSWLTRTAMPTARAGLVSATVNDRIYVIGGRNPQSYSLATVQRFSPSGTSLLVWTNRAALPQGRSWPSGAAMLNGKIYVTGGFASSGARTNTLFVYNPADNNWSTKAHLPINSAEGASAVINGKLYVLTPPASWGDPQQTRLHRYDPGTDQWTSRATAPINLRGAVVGVINGKLWAAGGVDSGFTTLGRTYVYDPAANTWSRRADMAIPRQSSAGLALNGKLYVFGGNGGSGAPATQGNTQVFTPGSGWAVKASMPTPRYVATAAVAGGRVYVIGGIPTTAINAVGTNEAYVP